MARKKKPKKKPVPAPLKLADSEAGWIVYGRYLLWYTGYFSEEEGCLCVCNEDTTSTNEIQQVWLDDDLTDWKPAAPSDCPAKLEQSGFNKVNKDDLFESDCRELQDSIDDAIEESDLVHLQPEYAQTLLDLANQAHSAKIIAKEAIDRGKEGIYFAVAGETEKAVNISIWKKEDFPEEENFRSWLLEYAYQVLDEQQRRREHIEPLAVSLNAIKPTDDKDYSLHSFMGDIRLEGVDPSNDVEPTKEQIVDAFRDQHNQLLHDYQKLEMKYETLMSGFARVAAEAQTPHEARDAVAECNDLLAVKQQYLDKLIYVIQNAANSLQQTPFKDSAKCRKYAGELRERLLDAIWTQETHDRVLKNRQEEHQQLRDDLNKQIQSQQTDFSD